MLDMKNTLSSLYPYRIEMHAHSYPVSGCSEVSPEDICAVYSRLGYHSVVLSNHFLYKGEDKAAYLDYYLHDYEEFCKSAQNYGLMPILAAEIRFTENVNDYLIYGVDREMLEEIYDYLPYGVENFRKKYDLGKGVFIQAHPFRNHIQALEPNLLDGIEAINMHANHNNRNSLSLKYAKENNLKIVTAGTDYHHPNLSHEAATALRTKFLPEDSFVLADILRSGDYIFEIGTTSLVIP